MKMGRQDVNRAILCNFLCGFTLTFILTFNPSYGILFNVEPPLISKYVHCEWPKNKDFLELSQQTVSCRLNLTVEPPSPHGLADLIFKFGSNISKVLHDDNRTMTLTLTFLHNPEHDYQVLTYQWPDDSYGLETVTFRVFSKPLEEHNISCEITNWKKMRCTWKPTVEEQQKKVHNTNVTNALEWRRKGEGMFKQCPDPEGGGCNWKVNTIPEDVTSISVGDLVEVKVIVNYTYNSHHFSSLPHLINTTAIVRPDPIANIELVQTNRDLSVLWTHPSPGHCIQCKLQASSKHDFKIIDIESKEERIKVQFESLYPNTVYNVTTTCRACSLSLWSEMTYKIHHTPAEVPEHHPLTRADGFETQDCSGAYCHVTFYWEPLEIFEENGDNFIYEVRTSQGDLLNTTRFSYKFTVDSEKAFDVKVFALNSVGRAHGQPQGVSLTPKDTKKAEFSVEAINNSVVNIEVEGGIQNFTVVWCPKIDNLITSYPGHCKDFIRWTNSDATSNNLTLTLPNSFEDFLFGVTTESAKAITWSFCSFDQREAPLPPKLHLSPSQESGSFSFQWKPIPCTPDQEVAFSDYHVVSYCPVESCHNSNTPESNSTCSESPVSIKVPRQEDSHKFKNLQVGVSFIAWVASVARNGQMSVASAPVCHVIVAPWLNGKVVAGLVIGSTLLAFFLITGAYFMAIRCRKAREWIKGQGMEINVPEKEKFSSQKTLTSEHLSTRGITNSCGSFDSGLGTISSDYHHVFMMRGMSSESEVDEVFDEHGGSEHLTSHGGRHYTNSFSTLPTLSEGRALKQMGKGSRAAQGQSGGSRGSGYHTSLGSYVLQPGTAESVTGSPYSDYALPDAVPSTPINTSNSNNNDQGGSLEDINCNTSCKSLPMEDLTYISTEDLSNGNQIMIPKEVLRAPDQGYVTNYLPCANHRKQSSDPTSNSYVSDPSQLNINIPVPSVTLGENSAHYIAHPQGSFNTRTIAEPDDRKYYLPRDNPYDKRLKEFSQNGISLSPQQTDGYVISETPQTFNANVRDNPLVTKCHNPYISVSERKSPVSMPKYNAAKDGPKTIHRDSGHLLSENMGYVELPVQGESNDSLPLNSVQPKGLILTRQNSSSLPSLLSTDSYVALPSSNQGKVATPQLNKSLSSTLSTSQPHMALNDATTSSPTIPMSPCNFQIPSQNYTSISSPSSASFVNNPVISSSGYAAAPTSHDNIVASVSSPVGFTRKPASSGYIDVTPKSCVGGRAASPENSPNGHTSTPVSTSGVVSHTVPSSAHIISSQSINGYLALPSAFSPNSHTGTTAYSVDHSPSLPNSYAVSSSVAAAPVVSAYSENNPTSSYVVTPAATTDSSVLMPTAVNNADTIYLSGNVQNAAHSVASPSVPENGYAPKTSINGYLGAHPKNTCKSSLTSVGYVAVPPSSVGGNVVSSQSNLMAEISSNSHATVANSQVTSNGYVAMPHASINSIPCTTTNSSSNYLAGPSSSNGYVSLPSTSNGHVTAPAITTPSGYAAATVMAVNNDPPPASSSYAPAIPTSSSSLSPGLTPAPTASDYIPVPAALTNAIQPTAHKGYATVPQNKAAAGGYVTAAAAIASADHAVLKATPTDSSLATAPNDVNSLLNTKMQTDATSKPVTLSSYVPANLSSSGYVTGTPSSDGYIMTPAASFGPNVIESYVSGNVACTAPETSTVRTPISSGHTVVPCRTRRSDEASVNGYETLPSSTSVPIPATVVETYTAAPPVTLSGHTAHSHSSPNNSPKNLSPAINGYVSLPSPVPISSHEESHNTSQPNSSISLAKGQPTLSGYVTLPSLSTEPILSPLRNNASTDGNEASTSPASLGGYVVLPSASPTSCAGGYVKIPERSTDPTIKPTPALNGYIAAPLLTPGGCVTSPATSTEYKTLPETSSSGGYVTSPANTTDGYVTLPESSSGAAYVSSPATSSGGDATFPATSTDCCKTLPEPSGGNVAVAKTSHAGDYQTAPLSSTASGCGAMSQNYNGYTCALPDLVYSSQPSTTLPPPGDYATKLAALRNDQAEESISNKSLETVNGYIAIPPTVPASLETQTILCNEELLSDYVTNQPSSMVKPNYVVFV